MLAKRAAPVVDVTDRVADSDAERCGPDDLVLAGDREMIDAMAAIGGRLAIELCAEFARR